MGNLEFESLTAVLRMFQGNLALIGTGKNAGKTTALNFLLREFPRPVTGVTSIGRDGERLDVLEKHAKPAIHVSDGTIFATAQSCLSRIEGRFTVLESTAVSTPLGSVLLCQADAFCRVELAGPSQVEDLVRISRRMREFGAARVWIDGAFDRIAGAAGRLSGAVLLAAGSAGRANVEDAARDIQNFVRRFQLPVLSQDEASTNGWTRLSSLTDAQLPGLEGARVVIPGPASCLLDEGGWRWIDSGRMELFVEGKPDLLAVLTSPFRPHLPPLDGHSLLTRVRQLCQNVSVFDLKLEGFFQGHAFTQD